MHTKIQQFNTVQCLSSCQIFLESASNCKDGVQWNCERGDMGLCVYRKGSTKKWSENDCNWKKTFACKKALRQKGTSLYVHRLDISSVTHIIRHIPDCPRGWSEFKGQCYIVAKDDSIMNPYLGMSFKDAIEFCKNHQVLVKAFVILNHKKL